MIFYPKWGKLIILQKKLEDGICYDKQEANKY